MDLEHAANLQKSIKFKNTMFIRRSQFLVPAQ